MMRNKLILVVVGLSLAWSCQKEAPLPDVELPGLSLFLQSAPPGIDQYLKEKTTDEKLQQLLVLKTDAAQVSAARLGAASGCWLTAAAPEDLDRIDRLWETRTSFPPLKVTEPNRLPGYLFGVDIMKVYTYEAAEWIHSAGKEALLAFADGDELKMMLMGLKRFCKVEPFNTKEARQRIAVELIEANKYED